MTEQIRSAIAILKAEYRHHLQCSIMGESLDTAIRSLQAWGEVLQELEELKREFKNDKNIHGAIAVNISIKRIKQHLAEIE